MLNSIQRFKFKSTMIAAAMAVLPMSAFAAGLGKLTVLSALGQPLRAELDITASRDELASLGAHVAPAETFQQAGIEYVPAAAALKFVVDKRSGGQPFLRVSSDRAINEPFIDVLIELVWSSGRMVREYTVLLDPPNLAKPNVPAVAESAPVVATPVVTPKAVPTAAPAAPAVAIAPAAPEKAAEKPAEPAATPAPKSRRPEVSEAKQVAATHMVQRGDTLAKIAAENKVDGINLDQMLAALFHVNQDAFVDGNMNRLRVGKILNIPDRETAGNASPSEARKIVVSQAEDFNAYRRKLASAVSAAKPVAEEAPKQAAAGKITPKVEEKVPAPAVAKDKLEVSRTESAKEVKAAKDANKALQGRVTALEEDLVARDRALKEAGSRVSDLEKNLADLKKLAELKSQTIVKLQQQAAAKPAVMPTPEVKKPELPPAVKPAEVPPIKPAEVAKAPEPIAPPPAVPVEPPKVAEAPKPPEPAAAPGAEAEKPPVKAPEVKKPEPQAAGEQPSFLDENLELVVGGGLVLAVLLGYLGYSALRRKRDTGAPTTSRISEGDLMANSVFGSTGGQAVDTGASIQTDFSQANLSNISADEGVDPVAEADVYMAYGRDAQAEEILLDALKNDPARHAIHLKLLEIYAARKSPKQFEAIAKDLHQLTSGAGPDWDKAAAMGRALDPENSFYGQGEAGTATSAYAADMAATTIIVPPTQAEKLREAVEMVSQQPVVAAVAPVAELDATDGLDFDLDVAALSSTETKAGKEASLDFDVGELAGKGDMDFNLNDTNPLGNRSVPAPAPASASDLDFHFDIESPDEPGPSEDDFSPNATHLSRVTTPAGAGASLAEAQPSRPSSATHLNVAESAVAATVLPASESVHTDELSHVDTHINRSMTETHLDLGGIDLNLDATIPMPAAHGGDADDPDVATKIELAQAYEEMGDKEGARELLQEVLQEGSSRQRDLARSRLAALGG